MLSVAALPEFDPKNGIHVFVFPTQEEAAQLREYEQWLSAEETQRAHGIRLSRSHTAFVVTRSMLRLVLSRATGIEPAALRLDYGPFGKPSMTESRMEFSVTHSGELAAIAVTNAHCVGIDVERRRESSRIADLIDYACSARERSEILAQPEGRRTAAFLRYWTRKEAVLKALGWGLRGLSRVEITGTPPQVRVSPHSKDEPLPPNGALRLVEVPVPHGYFGALATCAGREVPTVCHNL